MKFSIITPTYNSKRFIDETMESVLSQKCCSDIEYIIVDNCSTDGTIDIVRNYESLVKEGFYNSRSKTVSLKWISEKDAGMYDAINKGFSLATGDIYGWINSDDIYLPGAFDSIGRSFLSFPDVKWLKGITSYINEDTNIFQAGKCFLYDQNWTREGIYGKEIYFIQQDSVFWRSDLWKIVGGIDPNLKLAGDYYLWIRFSEQTPLYSIKAYISCFRKVEGQLSREFTEYLKECDTVSLPPGRKRKLVRTYFRFLEPKIPVSFRPLLYRLFFGNRALPFIKITNGKPEICNAHYYIV
jgi:glycosyltransferase involved in cell wall biosynthesis